MKAFSKPAVAKEVAKIKGSESGVGFSINNFERAIEIKANLSNEKNTGHRLTDKKGSKFVLARTRYFTPNLSAQ